jgi:hypothetical protein
MPAGWTYGSGPRAPSLPAGLTAQGPEGPEPAGWTYGSRPRGARACRLDLQPKAPRASSLPDGPKPSQPAQGPEGPEPAGWA